LSSVEIHKSCDFSSRLHALWKASGLEQKDLAAALGQKRRTVQGWIEGPNRPNFENLIGLADYFGITVDELLRDLTPAHRARLVLRLDLPALVDHLNGVVKAVESARALIESTEPTLAPPLNIPHPSRAAKRQKKRS
jgi:transcriptional regulator with XRE-family HTH domain